MNLLLQTSLSPERFNMCLKYIKKKNIEGNVLMTGGEGERAELEKEF